MKAHSGPSSQWARAFALQALSDLRARDILSAGVSDRCHTLHYLQMATEKVCKAHLHAQGKNVRQSHRQIVGVLERIARREISGTSKSFAYSSWFMQAVAHFADEIEALAPAVRTGGREANCEYPWEDSHGRVHTPCLHKFSRIDENDRTVKRIVTLIRSAAEEYAAIPATVL